MNLLFSILVALMTVSVVSESIAQEENRERRRRDFNIEEWLKARDRNGNGMLEPNELQDRDRQFLERMEVDLSRPIAIRDLVTRVNSEREEQAKQRANEEFDKLPRKIPGFGEPIVRQDLPSFGVTKETKEDQLSIPGFGLSESEVAETMVSIREQFGREIDRQVQGIFEQYDADQNGILDARELAEIPWGNPPWQEFDENQDGQLSKLEVAKRFQARSANRDRNRDRPDQSNDGGDNRRGRDFRGGQENGGGGDFRGGDFRGGQQRGDRGQSGNEPEPNRSSTSTTRSSRGTTDMAAYARQLMAEHDTNKNGVLDGDELENLRIIKNADADKNGEITYEELLAYVSGSTTTSGQSSQNNDASSRETRPSTRSSLRPNRRNVEQPAGEGETRIMRDLQLPGTVVGPTDERFQLDDEAINARRVRPSERFLKLDKNQDGQIQLSEFAEGKTLTQEIVDQFNQLDTDGDGLISVVEFDKRSR
ncbi:MAG TPA: EF-hand domain-containing protein [Pirellulaceae bacterium]|nr:EF-hand domain-containing protein [Pirellulaceae bacterium]HMO91645.1 EF-hand domain-containing protein [Pirellulaceae bacterium]HMP68342.1 EF-hand domain-containing protein [Pirellulaceae bacterium]